MRLRVSGVNPKGQGGAQAPAGALIRVWRPCEAVQQLQEGSLVIATGLCAGTDGRSSLADGRPGLLELSTTKMTRCVAGAGACGGGVKRCRRPDGCVSVAPCTRVLDLCHRQPMSARMCVCVWRHGPCLLLAVGKCRTRAAGSSQTRSCRRGARAAW
jgi:hypothetical protein